MYSQLIYITYIPMYNWYNYYVQHTYISNTVDTLSIAYNYVG